MLAPGILVAATGVGAGDLLTASFAGSVVGMSILWAAPAGASFRNGRVANSALVATLLLFAYVAAREVVRIFSG